MTPGKQGVSNSCISSSARGSSQELCFKERNWSGETGHTWAASLFLGTSGTACFMLHFNVAGIILITGLLVELFSFWHHRSSKLFWNILPLSCLLKSISYLNIQFISLWVHPGNWFLESVFQFILGHKYLDRSPGVVSLPGRAPAVFMSHSGWQILFIRNPGLWYRTL